MIRKNKSTFCDVPMFGPILLTGERGEGVSLALAFQSSDSLDMNSSLPADVICQSELLTSISAGEQ